MDDFLKKWHGDKKYQAKVKLLIYLVFVIAVSIYAVSQNGKYQESMTNDEEEVTIDNKTIDVPNTYSYLINVSINEKEYKFMGTKNDTDETIVRTIDEVTETFIQKNNEYYKEINNNYFKTTRNAVYEPVNYEYINLENINLYLAKARKNNKDYIVYIKDIILNNTSDEYFIISINNNYINIDYTPLIKQIDSEIYKYVVNIEIIKEWKRWKNERSKE